MMKILLFLYLLTGAIWDVCTQKLPGIWIWAGGMGAGAYAFWQIIGGERSIENLILSLLPGILCYVFAKASHAMGEGDAWLILIMGLCLPFYDLAKVLLTAFFLSAVGSILWLIGKRGMKDRRIPFVPFLFMAAGFVLMG